MPHQPESRSFLNPWTFGLIVVLVVFLCYINYMCVEHFKTKQDKAKFVQEKTYPMFYGGSASFTQYKELVPTADAVEYADVKKLYKDNKFTADNLIQVV